MGESDIYSPYSYYGGSEAGGGDVADNDSVWGMPSVNVRKKTEDNFIQFIKFVFIFLASKQI